MPEGGVYLSAWSFEGGVFRLWLEEDPSLETLAEDFDSAADALSERIGEWNGDGEAVLEFADGRPGDGGPGVLWRLRALGYNESVRAVARDASQFEDGICEHCAFGLGARTSVSLEVSSWPKGHVAGVDRTLPGALIVSEEFLDLLDGAELARVRTQPVRGPRGRSFVELVGDPVDRTVGVRGAEYPEAFLQSWRCSRCETHNFVVDHPEFGGSTMFLATVSLTLPPPSLFVFDTSSRLALAVTIARWEELAAQRAAKGFTSDDLLVIDTAIAEPSPTLSEPSEFDWIL